MLGNGEKDDQDEQILKQEINGNIEENDPMSRTATKMEVVRGPLNVMTFDGKSASFNVEINRPIMDVFNALVDCESYLAKVVDPGGNIKHLCGNQGQVGVSYESRSIKTKNQTIHDHRRIHVQEKYFKIVLLDTKNDFSFVKFEISSVVNSIEFPSKRISATLQELEQQQHSKTFVHFEITRADGKDPFGQALSMKWMICCPCCWPCLICIGIGYCCSPKSHKHDALTLVKKKYMKSHFAYLESYKPKVLPPGNIKIGNNNSNNIVVAEAVIVADEMVLIRKEDL